MKANQTLLLFFLACLLIWGCKKDDPDPGGNGGSDTQLAVSSINPGAGAEGTKVVIGGTGFGTSSGKVTVKFGTVSAVIDSLTNTRIVTKVPSGAKTGRISVEVNGKNASGDFTVSANPPVFGAGQTANTSEAVTATGGNVSSTISAKGGGTITQHGHVWSKTNNPPTLADGKSELGKLSDAAVFPYKISSELKNLEANTSYHVRAYIISDNVTVYGEVFQLKTISGSITVSIPNLSYQIVVTHESIELPGYAHTSEANLIGEVGFCYSDSKAEPTVADNKLAVPNVPFSSDNMSKSFNARIEGLKPLTKYNVRAFAVINNIPVYSSVSTFNTVAKESNASVTKRADFPGNTVAGKPISFVIKNKLYINARKGNSDDSEFYEYDPATDKWSKKADITITGNNYKGGTNGISFEHNGKGYFGLSTGFSAQKSLWEYDPTTDKWAEVATFTENPFGAWSFLTSDVYLKGKVYAVNYDKHLIEYDVVSRKGSRKTAPPGIETSSNQLIVRDQTMYFYNVYKGTMAEYNSQADTWISKKTLPSRTASLVAVNGHLYSLGDVIMQYDHNADSWKETLKLGSASYVYEQYRNFTSPAMWFSNSTSAYLGLRGNGVGKQWYEFKP